MTYHVIERDVEIPELTRKKGGVWADLANKMSVGDSVELKSTSEVSGLVSALKKRNYNAAQRKHLNKYRVWRTQ